MLVFEFWNWFGHVADFLGVITVIVALLTYLKVRKESKRLLLMARAAPRAGNLLRDIEDNEGVSSEKPVALAISLIPTNDSLKPNVERFLAIQGWEMDVLEIKADGIIPPQGIEKLVNELTAKKREITARGFTEVHLFVAAPMPACILIGSMLRSWMPVKLYHKPTPAPAKIYEYWTPLI